MRNRPSGSAAQRLVAWAALGFILLVPSGRTPAAGLAEFRCQERLGIDWPETLVTYRVRFGRGKLRAADQVKLVDGEAGERPCQLWQVEKHSDGSIAAARVSFYAGLPAEGSYYYRLEAGRPVGSTGQVRISREAGGLVLDNGSLAVRFLAEGEHDCSDAPLALARWDEETGKVAADAADAPEAAPGPIRAVRLADGRWVGASSLVAGDPDSLPRVVRYTCNVVEQGPLFAKVRVRYEMEDGAFYQMTARLPTDRPELWIDEQADLGTIGGDADDSRLVVFLAGDGWRPDHAFWQSPEGRLSGKVPQLRDRFAAIEFETDPYEHREFGAAPLKFDRPQAEVLDLSVWYPWFPVAHYFALVRAGDLAGSGGRRAPFLAVVPVHAGNWRGAHQTFQRQKLCTHAAGQMSLHLPLRVSPHPNTILHTGIYDPELPFTFLRRQWILVGGPVQYHDTLYWKRRWEGYITLDHYKDWILDWREDKSKGFPRLVFGAEEVRKLAGRLEQHPGGDVLAELLYFNDDEERAGELWNKAVGPGVWSGPRGHVRHELARDEDLRYPTRWQSSFRQAQEAHWAGYCDELLSSSHLTAEQRKALRAYVAAACYTLSHPDLNPRGSMIHLGNPNMPMNRFAALPFAAALVPDHPEAGRWLDVSDRELRYTLSRSIAPGGAWLELVTYFHAGASHLMQASAVLRQQGKLDDETARLAALPARFTLQLVSPPDPRLDARHVPCWGHEGHWVSTHWLAAAALIREQDPELARAFAWAWDQGGRPMDAHHDAGFSPRLVAHADLLDGLPAGYVPKELRSTWLPGFGAVLRAHAGHPQETYLSYRQGYLTSHSDANQGDFVIYAKGAPLSVMSLFGYAIHNDRPYGKLSEQFGWHNRVRFGEQTNAGEWPGGGMRSQVHAHHFSPEVDYLRGEGLYDPQLWTRQILFLKSKQAEGPNYFVLRDSFHNPEGDPAKLQRKWWYLRTPGPKQHVSTAGAGFTFQSPFGPRLLARFLAPSQVRLESREATQEGPMYFQAARNWRRAGSPIADDRQETNITIEETMTVTAAGPIEPGQDILVLLYPQGEGEPEPKVESLADGVARITTAEGTDYVFLDREPFTYEGDDVRFEGIAGTVRVRSDGVHLAVTEGAGTVGFRGVTLRTPVPAERSVPQSQLGRTQTIEVPAPERTIEFPPPAEPESTEQIVRGVTRYELADGFALRFDAQQPIIFRVDEATFIGRRGGIRVRREEGTVELVMIEGERVGYGEVAAYGASGPYAVTVSEGAIAVKSEGPGRFLYVDPPQGLDKLPLIQTDEGRFVPGTSGKTLIVPLMPSVGDLEIRNPEQPPVFRVWQAW